MTSATLRNQQKHSTLTLNINHQLTFCPFRMEEGEKVSESASLLQDVRITRWRKCQLYFQLILIVSSKFIMSSSKRWNKQESTSTSKDEKKERRKNIHNRNKRSQIV